MPPSRKRVEQIQFEIEYLRQFVNDQQSLIDEVLAANDVVSGLINPVTSLMFINDDRARTATERVMSGIADTQKILLKMIELATSTIRLAEGNIIAVSKELEESKGGEE